MFRSIGTSVLRVAARLLFRVRVEGLDSHLSAPKLLIIANHESFLDGLLLGLFLPFNPVFVVHTAVLRVWFFRRVLALGEYLAVDPTSPMAIKTIVRLVESGRPVVIFPEGRITVTGSLMKVYDGPAFVAVKTAATILPVRLDGPARSYFTYPAGRRPRRFFPRITISVQKPVTMSVPPAPTAKARRRQSGEAMRRLMQKMIFDSQPKQTLYSGLIDAISIYGRRRRVLEDIKQIEYSYNELLKMTLALGRIVARHTEPGACFGILLPNVAATVCMLIGSNAFGRIPAMLNYKAGTAGMQDACTAAVVRTIFTSRAFLEQASLEADVAALKNVKTIYLEDLQPQFTLLDKLRVAGAMLLPRTVEAAPDPERPAVVLFTSGSEGTPKGVVLSHRALLSNIAQVRAVVDFSPEDKLLNALPLFHAMGLTDGALMPLLTGMKLFLYPTPLHYRIIPELIYDRNCSVLFGTNTFFANYAKFAHPYDFFRLRYAVAGAEKLSDAVRKLWFEKFGIRIFEGYGATEAAPVIATNTPMTYRTGTVGPLLPAIEHRLIPVPGIEQGGMLHIKGPNLMSGYLRVDAPGKLQPPRSEAGEGWYETGDVVAIDEDGFLSIIGRVKRFAKVAGEMVSLEVAEKVAVHASAAAAHAATTRADSGRGETIVLFTTDSALSRDALADAARRLGVPEIAVPKKVVAVPSLPLLGTGKVNYVALKKMAEAA
jgi:acyl-[acyl-carrier-protein]-phospholipid O-acyltransferase / long-chain-fatty-acid--[acyl-carrier-protein] ligase